MAWSHSDSSTPDPLTRVNPTMTADLTRSNHTVTVYSTHAQAEAAIIKLKDAGFEMKNLSIIGQDYYTDEQPVGYINTGDRMLFWGRYGAFWGSIWGLLFGSAMMIVPGVGPVLFAGYIVAAIEGAVLGGGAGVIGGALASIGVPENSVINYQSAIRADGFLLLVRGSESDVEKARLLLESTSPTQTDSYPSRPIEEVGLN